MQITIIHVFRVFKLVTLILILAYFVGTFWFILTKFTTNSEDESTFYNDYGLHDNTNARNLVVLVYFAFTTLSTVGFGDYYPKSDIERLVCILIFLVGVAIFSFMMNEFILILLELEKVTKENEERESLSKWMGMLTHFNGKRPLPKPMIKRFEDYFEYYWAKDKNHAFCSEADKRFLKELPKGIRCKIYKEFLFKDFLYLFKKHFTFVRQDTLTKIETTYWSWNDSNYLNFMIKLL